MNKVVRLLVLVLFIFLFKSVVLSLLIPLLQIPVFTTNNEAFGYHNHLASYLFLVDSSGNQTQNARTERGTENAST